MAVLDTAIFFLGGNEEDARVERGHDDNGNQTIFVVTFTFFLIALE